MQRLDIDHLLTELTLEEKASLTIGSGFWYTAPVEWLAMTSLGPEPLRPIGDHDPGSAGRRR